MRLMALVAMLLIPPLTLLAMVLPRMVIEIPPDALFAATPGPPLRSILVLAMVTRALLPPTAGCTTIPPPVDGARPLLTT